MLGVTPSSNTSAEKPDTAILVLDDEEDNTRAARKGGVGGDGARVAFQIDDQDDVDEEYEIAHPENYIYKSRLARSFHSTNPHPIALELAEDGNEENVIASIRSASFHRSASRGSALSSASVAPAPALSRSRSRSRGAALRSFSRGDRLGKGNDEDEEDESSPRMNNVKPTLQSLRSIGSFYYDATAQFEHEPRELSLICSDKKREEYEAIGGWQGLVKTMLPPTSWASHPKVGLQFPGREAQNLRIFYGTNRIPLPPQKPFLRLVWEALADDTMMIMLCFAAAISLILGLIEETSEDTSTGWIEGTAIFISVSIVVLVSAGNDYSKEKQFRKLNAVKDDSLVDVIRNGHAGRVPSSDLQVGDIMQVTRGMLLSCDGWFISGDDVVCDEKSATGEGDAMPKGPFSTAEGKKHQNPFFISGTKVISGVGWMIVVAVGKNSFNGHLKMSLRVEPEDTPLQQKLEILATKVGKLGVVMAVLTLITLSIKIIVTEALSDDGIESDLARRLVRVLIVAISIVVVAVPEGLPLAVTISLAYSMMKMLKDKNLVRQLDACETMGGATTICSDKTGTLTQGIMTVVRGIFGGESFDLRENGLGIPQAAQILRKKMNATLGELLESGLSINSTAYQAPNAKTGIMEFLGDPTEASLLAFVDSFGVDYLALRDASPPSIMFAFSSKRKRMTTVVKSSDGSFIAHLKGASEIVLARCTHWLTADGNRVPLDEDTRAKLAAEIDSMASDQLRTIGIAYRNISVGEYDAAARVEGFDSDEKDGGENEEKKQDIGENAQDDGSCLEHGHTLVGIVGIQDPLRVEVPKAVEDCRDAGVRIIMVTGDNLVTAKNIATSCGILRPLTIAGRQVDGVAMQGPELRKLSKDELLQLIPRLQVVARCSPTDKQLLVKAIRSTGEVVAVTGDGANDAPALAMADVGFAMGIGGTDVARDASKIVLMDDNFASIVSAISWGRNVFDGIRSFLQFQLTVNVVALALTFVGAVTDSEGESPLTPVQLLWVNLIMDTLAALALATQPPTPALLTYKPYGKDEPLITRLMWRSILGQAFFQLIVLFVLLYYGHELFDVPHHGITHKTIVFNEFVLLQLVNQFNSRSIYQQMNPFANLRNHKLFMYVWFAAAVFQVLIVELGGSFTSTTALSLEQWLFCLLIAMISFPVAWIISSLPYTPLPDEERYEWTSDNQLVLKSKPGMERAVSIGEFPPSLARTRLAKMFNQVNTQSKVVANWRRYHRGRGRR